MCVKSGQSCRVRSVVWIVRCVKSGQSCRVRSVVWIVRYGVKSVAWSQVSGTESFLWGTSHACMSKLFLLVSDVLITGVEKFPDS